MFRKKTKAEEEETVVPVQGSEESVEPVRESGVHEEKAPRGISYSKPSRYDKGKKNPEYQDGQSREYVPNTRTIPKKPENAAKQNALEKKPQQGISSSGKVIKPSVTREEISNPKSAEPLASSEKNSKKIKKENPPKVAEEPVAEKPPVLKKSDDIAKSQNPSDDVPIPESRNTQNEVKPVVSEPPKATEQQAVEGSAPHPEDGGPAEETTEVRPEHAPAVVAESVPKGPVEGQPKPKCSQVPEVPVKEPAPTTQTPAATQRVQPEPDPAAPVNKEPAAGVKKQSALGSSRPPINKEPKDKGTGSPTGSPSSNTSKDTAPQKTQLGAPGRTALAPHSSRGIAKSAGDDPSEPQLKVKIGNGTQFINTASNSTDSNSFIKVIDGDKFNKNLPATVSNPVVSIPGSGLDGALRKLDFDARMLSTHVAMIGGIGVGKSNTFNHFISQVRNSVTSDDLVIIFDTKGDFLNDFGTEDDIVISNDSRAHGVGREDYWNIFREVDSKDVEGSIREIASSLFRDAIEHSSNAFFPNAAADLFYGIMRLHYAGWRKKTGMEPNNRDLIRWIKTISPQELFEVLNKNKALKAIASHISDPKSGQSQGVIAEMNAVLNRVFVGNFAKCGTLSMSELVRLRGGRNVFIEYDIKSGEVLSPIYSLLIDMALKETLSNTGDHHGSVYLFIDEFKLLPNLSHIDDAVNFGRSLGMKVFIALQAITQMYESYGEMKAKSILSGFLNYIFFNVNNAESREFIKERFGKCILEIMYAKAEHHVYEDYVVRDKDITRLGMGDAIIGFQNVEPFVFHFDRWEKNKPQ